MKTGYFQLILLIVLSPCWAQEKTDFKKASFQDNNFTLPYRILYPKEFDVNKSYPLLLFLHGAGERGSDNEKQLTHGSSLFLNAQNREDFPAILVFPQCPEKDYWSNVNIKMDASGSRVFDFSPKGAPTVAMSGVINLMDSLINMNTVDKDRVYVGGLSMGGMGTFEIVKRRPNIFAAAFPICGGGNPKGVKKYAKKVSFWVFHGAEDDVVLPEHSEKMVKAIKKKKGEVKFSLYPEANHNSWDGAFSEPELLSWIFSKNKNITYPSDRLPVVSGLELKE